MLSNMLNDLAEAMKALDGKKRANVRNDAGAPIAHRARSESAQ